MELSAIEVRAAYYAVANIRRAAALVRRPVPPSVEALSARLEVVMRAGEILSRRRQSAEGVAEESDSATNEWIGTRLAAEILGWNMRQVERRANDFCGCKVSERWIFPAATVNAYRDAMEKP
ncbi:MAG: hypothetical protein ACOYB7_02505 [Mycobacterium sp.]